MNVVTQATISILVPCTTIAITAVEFSGAMPVSIPEIVEQVVNLAMKNETCILTYPSKRTLMISTTE